MPTCLPASLLNAVRTFLHWETNITENMQLLGGAMNSGEYSLSALHLFTNCDFIKNLTLVEFKAGPTQRFSSTLTSCHSLSVNVIRLSQTKSLRSEYSYFVLFEVLRDQPILGSAKKDIFQFASFPKRLPWMLKSADQLMEKRTRIAAARSSVNLPLRT